MASTQFETKFVWQQEKYSLAENGREKGTWRIRQKYNPPICTKPLA